jgi:hypothetical protein
MVPRCRSAAFESCRLFRQTKAVADTYELRPARSQNRSEKYCSEITLKNGEPRVS